MTPRQFNKSEQSSSDGQSYIDCSLRSLEIDDDLHNLPTPMTPGELSFDDSSNNMMLVARAPMSTMQRSSSKRLSKSDRSDRSRSHSPGHRSMISSPDSTSEHVCCNCESSTKEEEEEVEAVEAPSKFECEYCERHLCGNCIANVPCEGNNCNLSNCIECAENGNGDVLYCTHCGLGYCTDCKSMEYCYCLEGDACPECHREMHDYDVELYWRHLPTDLQKIVSEFASMKLNSSDRLAEFWQECVHFLPADDEFDLRLYRRNRRARAASLILAAYYLLQGHEKEAIYLILYAALLEEVWNRGANYLKLVFDTGSSSTSSPSAKLLSVYFTSFNSVVDYTSTRAGMMTLIHNQLPSIREKEGRKLFECIDFALSKVQKETREENNKSHAKIHSGTMISPDTHEEEFSDGGSLSMHMIVASSKDSEMKQKNFVYKDMSLTWWLKVYVIKCMYHKWLTSPVTPSTEYYRIVHQGKTIFLASAGNKTLHQLGIRDGDEIVVEGIETAPGIPAEASIRSVDSVMLCELCDEDRPATTFDFCMGCDQEACVSCSASFFDCDYCERMLCGCVPDVPCEGPGCDLNNCIECAENGDGDVLFCTNCGEGYCTDCKPMEFCFCLVGDTCSECHSKMHEDDIEYNWQHLPKGIHEFIAHFASLDMSCDQLVKFWQACVQFLPQDKDFDIRVHRKTRQARAAALILASYHLLMGQDLEAVYLTAYAELLKESWNRGPNYIRKTLDDDDKKDDVQLLAIFFHSFDYLILHTRTKGSLIAFLHSQVQGVSDQEGKELFKCMDSGLGRMLKSSAPFHRVPANLTDRYARAREFPNSEDMTIVTSNMDSGEKEESTVPKDMSLGWWLRYYQIQRSYGDWLRNPEIPPPTTKFFRVVHKGKTIFLSSAGKNTLHQLGIKPGDEIVVGGVEVESDESDPETNKQKVKKDNNKKKKKSNGPRSNKKKKKKKQPKTPILEAPLTEEQLMEQWRQEHSQNMTPVFEELGPSLKDIRNRLNDMMTKKSAPKIRRTSPKKKAKPEISDPTLPPGDAQLGGKAGKHCYPILVGDVDNLYKTSKASRKSSKSYSGKHPITTLDLHGLSQYEALKKLDVSLPVWVANAMKGESPWVIPVDIICGGGGQVLSEVVKEWIRNNSQVANRPKNPS